MLNKKEVNMIKDESQNIQTKLNLIIEHMSTIEKINYQMLIERIKTNALLESLVDIEKSNKY
jgi:hypothetical protein